MDDDIEFNEAAFEHGVTKEKILWAVRHPMYEGPLENEDNKYLVLGFDTAGNLLEVIYNRIDDETVNIFHAMTPCAIAHNKSFLSANGAQRRMKCRSKYYHLLGN